MSSVLFMFCPYLLFCGCVLHRFLVVQCMDDMFLLFVYSPLFLYAWTIWRYAWHGILCYGRFHTYMLNYLDYRTSPCLIIYRLFPKTVSKDQLILYLILISKWWRWIYSQLICLHIALTVRMGHHSLWTSNLGNLLNWKKCDFLYTIGDVSLTSARRRMAPFL